MSRTVKAALAAAGAALALAIPLVRRRNGGAAGVLRSYYDAWAKADADGVRDLLTDDYRGHVHTLAGTETHDVDEIAARIESHGDAFEYVEYELGDVIASDGRVAARVKMRASHRETGREGETVGLVILRLDGGRIAEEWSSWDYLGLAAQLGLDEALS